MLNKEDGKNKNIWCGEVVEPLTFSHSKKNNDIVSGKEKFYKFSIKTKVVTSKGKLLDESVLPMVVSEQQLTTLGREVEIGDIVFLRGSWRAYSKSNSRKIVQMGYIKEISHTELKDGKYLNRFDFEGYLVDKLYVPMRDENGKPIIDSQTGKFKPLLDESGKKQWTVRLNKEKKIVNDYTIAINKKERSFYIPTLSYFELAKKIAKDIHPGMKVKGSGYIRSRRHEDLFGNEKIVYEAVATTIEVLPRKLPTNKNA